MDKRICEMTDFVVENGLELNILSSDIVIKLYNDRIRRVEKFLEKFGEAPGEGTIALLIKVIEYANKNGIADDELQQMQETLVLLLTYSLNIASYSPRKTLKKLRECQEDELWKHCFLEQMRKKVFTQSNKNKKTDIDNDTSFWNDLEDVMKRLYEQFHNEVKDISWLENSPCTYRWENVIKKGREMYPVLPGALAYDAVRQVNRSRSCALEKIAEPELDLPSWDRSVLDTRHLYKSAIALYKEIEETLAGELCKIYTPCKISVSANEVYQLVFGSPKDKRPDEDEIDTDVIDFNNGDEMNTSAETDQEQTIWVELKAKMFEVIRCKPIDLGRQIANCYDFSLEQMIWLYQNIAMYMWMPISQLAPLIEKELGNDIGRTVLSVIQVFQKMGSAQYYYGKTGVEEPKWYELLDMEIDDATGNKKYGENIKKLFDNETNAKNQIHKRGKRIFDRYFHVENINFSVLTHTFSCPLIGNEKFAEEYFNYLMSKYRKHNEKEYGLPAYKAKKKKKKGAYKNPDMPEEVKGYLLKNMTIQRAVDFIKAYDDSITENEKEMKEQLTPYTGTAISDEGLQSYMGYTKKPWNKIYKLILASSLDVIGHYAIALLRHCMLRQCTIRFETETKRIDMEIAQIKNR